MPNLSVNFSTIFAIFVLRVSVIISRTYSAVLSLSMTAHRPVGFLLSQPAFTLLYLFMFIITACGLVLYIFAREWMQADSRMPSLTSTAVSISATTSRGRCLMMTSHGGRWIQATMRCFTDRGVATTDWLYNKAMM